MTSNATGGPDIVYGQNAAQPGTGYQAEYNQSAAPSIFYGGTLMMDWRWGYRPSAVPDAIGFQGSTFIPVINQAPSTASTSIIAAAQAPATGVALNLATQSSTGMTVLSAGVTVVPSGNTVPVGAIALDGVPGIQSYIGPPLSAATSGGVSQYDPTKALARNIRVQTNGNDGSGSYLVSGYDLYGYPQTEGIAGTSNASGGVQSGKKAFKFVTNVTPQGTIASTSVSVGTGDVIGLPLRADGFGDVFISYIANITSSAGFTAAVTTNPATSSTGDVRGTYSLQTASNNSNLLQVFVTPRAANLVSSTGLFGVKPA